MTPISHPHNEPTQPQPRNSQGRIAELDYLKCLFVLLMIAFHLAYFADGYPYLKKFVYTFHMPGFLLISGYLMNIDKPLRHFLRTLLWIAIPYVVMETGYVLMAALLPIRDHVDHLTPALLLRKLLIQPLGPYWYLHTIILSAIPHYLLSRRRHISTLTHLIVLSLVYYLMVRLTLIAPGSAIYFLLGIAIRRSQQSFTAIFKPSWWAWVALALLFAHPTAFDRTSLWGLLIVYMAIAAALTLLPHLRGRVRTLLLFLGRNSLPLYIFSPIFTICCKALIPLLSFDHTRLLFLAISLPLCVVGCLALCRLLDLLHLSPLLFGRKHSLA